MIALFQSYFIYSGLPSNITINWNYGSLLGIILAIQIATGITLAMHYTANVDYAFLSVEYIMRSVQYGWLIRYIHANGASLFFLFVYLHIARGIYAGSYTWPRAKLWNIGVIIYFIMAATAFLGYVLPFGQMSIWGATVITSLVSAIPYIGQDLVVLKKNLFIPIGKISPYALKNNNNDLEYLKEIPFSFIAMLTGFIDGDGHISISKSLKGYIKIKLVIALDKNELLLLKNFQYILKIGEIYEYKNKCIYIINRTDLQKIIFPLLKYHNIYFLTYNRKIEYEKALYIIKNEILYYKDIPKIINYSNNIEEISLQENIQYYINLKFFNNWIVGFTIAKGSFIIKKNKDGCFQLKQSNLDSEVLFLSFNFIFNSNKKFYIEENKEGNQFYQFSLSSKKDIQNVINFFSFSGNYPLQGNKLLQYEMWLEKLKNSKKYGDLKFPNS